MRRKSGLCHTSIVSTCHCCLTLTVGSCFAGVHTAEVKMGESIKVSFFFNQPIQTDITYLVRCHLQMCICVTASGGLLGQVLIDKPWFVDSKPRATGGLWPLPTDNGQWISADITHIDHQERTVAIIPHRRLLPSQCLWGGVRLCLGGRWWVVHGLGETHTHLPGTAQP